MACATPPTLRGSWRSCTPGKAGSTLLNTYQVEREPQVRQVMAKAIEAGRYICLLDPEAAARDARVRRMRDIETAEQPDRPDRVSHRRPKTAGNGSSIRR